MFLSCWCFFFLPNFTELCGKQKILAQGLNQFREIALVNYLQLFSSVVFPRLNKNTHDSL